MRHETKKWDDIKNDFRDGVVIGNGSSMAFSEKFGYRNLKSKAFELSHISPKVNQIFDFLTSSGNFEVVLRDLKKANVINEILGTSYERIANCYQQVQSALISVVKDIHSELEYDEIFHKLLRAGNFLSHFRNVASLNYDILVYWSLMAKNEESKRHAIKDCFINGYFYENFERLRIDQNDQSEISTLVAYPHGNLILGTTPDGEEVKVHVNERPNLINAITGEWTSSQIIPLFVSEGESFEKLAAIRNSNYLSKIYDFFLPNLGESVVLFGISFGEEDEHIAKAIFSGRQVRRVAYSMNPSDDSDQLDLNYLRIKQLIRKFCMDEIEIIPFDRNSPSLWVNS